MALFSLRQSILVGILLGLIAVYVKYPAPEMSQQLVTWHTSGKYFSFRGHQVFFKSESGKRRHGPVLVCLHGFPTSSFDWAKVWPGLLDKFKQVVAPDFIGFGFSDKPYDHGYAIMEQADMVEALMKELTVKNVHLLAHDYGDTVAQELMARYEERKEGHLVIKSVCLTNGGIFPETNFPRPVQRLLLVTYLGAAVGYLSNGIIYKRGLSQVFGPQTQPTHEELNDFYAALRFNDGHLVLHKILQYIPQRAANKHRWTGALEHASVPVHMIYGPADPVNPPYFVEFYRKIVPDPSITVLAENVGHYPFWEAPVASMTAFFHFLKTLPFE